MCIRDSPLAGPIVEGKARILSSKLDDSHKVFYARSNWLDGWKAHYIIRQLAVSDEQLSSDKGDTSEFKEEFNK